MKNPIPTPVIVGVVILAAALAGFFLFKGTSGPGELAPPPNQNKTIPKYIYDKMPPATQQKMVADGYKVSDGPPPNTQPTAKPVN